MDEGGEQSHDTWLAYMDILGYKAKVEKAEREGTQMKLVEDIRRALKSALGDDEENSGWEVHVFSDTIVFGLPKHPALDVLALLHNLVFIQAYFAFSGFIIRGAVASGWHHSDEHVIVSPALIKSYLAESNVAIYPRIVLTDEIRRELADCAVEEGKAFGRGPYLEGDAVWVDDDGQSFVNYLSIFDECEYAGEAFDCLGRHRDLVVREMTEWDGDPGVFRKLQWLVKYHNRYCRHRLADDVAEPYLVDVQPLLKPWETRAQAPITAEDLERWRQEDEGA